MDDKTQLIQPEQIESAVLLICGQRVLLDRDLAALYGVTTSNLNKAVKRNAERFPADFMFQPTMDEAQGVAGSRFQIGILKKGQNIKCLPHVFTQQGVAMLSSVLRSPREGHFLSASTGEIILRIQIRALNPRTGARSIAPLGPTRGAMLRAPFMGRTRVRCRFGVCHPPAGETAPRNRLSHHSQGRWHSGQSESQTQMKPFTLHQQSTLNHQLLLSRTADGSNASRNGWRTKGFCKSICVVG
jgi:hypothetical protein